MAGIRSAHVSLRALLILLWLAVCSHVVAAPAGAPKRILIVQSQPSGDLFHSAIVSSLTAAIPEQTPRVQVFVEALDASRLGLWSKPQFLPYLRLKYGTLSFDLLVTVGSPAAQAMRGPGAEWVAGKPWVAVNGGPSDLEQLKVLPNVIPIGNVGAEFTRNMELITELLPDVKHLLVVGKSATPQIQVDIENAISAGRSRYTSIERLDEGRDTVLIERLKSAPAHTAVFLAGWMEDATGQPVQGRELLWALAPRVQQPVFTAWDFVLGEGIVGGKMIVTNDLGQRAGEVVSGLLSGKTVADFDPMAPVDNHYIFDYRSLQRHGITESRLPAGSEVRYRPQSLVQSNPVAFYSGLAVITALVVALAATLFMLRIRRRAAHESARNERHFRMLFEANPMGLLVFDAQKMEILATNRRVEEILGRHVNDATAPLSALSFIPEGDRKDFEAAVWQRQGQPRTHVPAQKLVRSNGDTVICEMLTHAIDYFGKPARLVMVNDITQRLEAEAKIADHNEFLNTLLNTIPQPVFWKGADGRYLGGNQAMTQVFARPLHDIVGRTLKELSPDGDFERYIESDAALLANPGAQTFEDRMLFSDAQWHDVLVSKATYRHVGSEVLGLAGTITDISNIKRIEARLREANAELEQKVTERTSDLAHANEELKNAMQQLVQREKLASLGKLVAGVAHELNTPLGNALTVVTTLTDHLRQLQTEITQGTLRRSRLTQFLEDATHACSMLERNTQRAAELVTSFKLVAVDQTSARRRTFDLHSLIKDTLMAASPVHQGLPVSVEIDIPQAVSVDSYPGALEQVVTNLLQNAVLHGLANRKSLHIRVRAQTDADGQVVFLCVEDNGVGMDANSVRQAFDPFFTTRMGQGGSGLGLYIVFNLVGGMLGGSVQLESTPGTGTVFSMQIPRIAPS